MSTISETATSTANSASNTASAGKNVLDSYDFMKLMVTELTNQDPFEPMSNKELLQQMATMQELQSNQNMKESFNDMIGRLDAFVDRQKLSDANSMIGQMVLGETESGLDTYGQVVAVNVRDGEIYLELDNGWSVNLDKITRMGGTNSQNLVGSVVMGTNTSGKSVVGTVASIEMSAGGTILVLDNENHDRVSLTTAVPLNGENISGLVGSAVKGKHGGTTVTGVITSVQIDQNGDIALKLADGGQLALEELVEVLSLSSDS